MQVTMSVSDLQRNIGAVYEACHTSQQPVYITRNGVADLVVMDAEAFDRQMAMQRLAYEREMRTLEALERSEEDLAAGRVRSLGEIRRERASR